MGENMQSNTNEQKDVSGGVMKVLAYVRQLGCKPRYDGECLTVIFPENTTTEEQDEIMDKLKSFLDENYNDTLPLFRETGTDELNERIVEALWKHDKLHYEILYDDFILIKSFINMVLNVEYDVHDEQLESAICELGAYLNSMVKMKINKYSKYDKNFNRLPRLEQVWYEVLSDQLIKLIKDDIGDTGVKYEAIKQHMEDKVRSGGEYTLHVE